MLLSSVFFKSLRDRRMSMLFWLLGVSLLAVLFVSIFPLFSENDSLQQFADTMDKDMVAIFGIEELDYSTGDGFLNSEEDCLKEKKKRKKQIILNEKREEGNVRDRRESGRF